MLEIFITFFKIGLFTIGGGYAMIPLIEEEVVRRHQWLSKDDFTELLTLAQTCPGVFAVNFSVFIGYRLRRTPMALVAALGAVLPSFLIILLIAMFFQQFKDNRLATAVFCGLRPAVAALIAIPVFRLAQQMHITWHGAIIPVLVAVFITYLGFSPILIILIAGVAGVVWGRIKSSV